MIKKCGYVALLGRPNAGKSTLLNAMLETKLAVVSTKPQTTRNKILGIHTQENTQILFLDTPGIHKTAGLPRINQLMNKTAWSVLKDSDFVCYLIDLVKGWQEEDSLWIESILKKYKGKICIIGTKSDKLKKELVTKMAQQIKVNFENLVSADVINSQFIGQIPIHFSSKNKEEVLTLRSFIAKELPESEWFFDPEDISDRPQNFICAEMIREQIFRQLGEELPYKIAVVIDKFEHKANITSIIATVVVDRDSHKAIVIGARGSKIKSIGTDARLVLEKHLDRKVFLELFVKVKKAWTEDLSLLSSLADLNDLED